MYLEPMFGGYFRHEAAFLTTSLFPEETMHQVRFKDTLLFAAMILVLSWQCSPAYAQDEPSSPAPEALDYLNRALDIIQRSSLKRETDWNEYRRLTIEKAANARTPADTYPAIRDALKRLGDKHSGLLTPEDLKTLDSGRAGGTRIDLGIRVKDRVIISVFPNSSASRAAVEVGEKILAIDGHTVSADGDYSRIINEAKKMAAKGVELALKRRNARPRNVHLEFGEYDFNLPLRGRLVSKDIGLIELPQFGASMTDMKRAGEIATQFAERVQALIRELDVRHLKGWIIDLRQNSGGNMWPMLAGIGPILGEGDLGAFVSAGGSSTWSYHDGQAMINKNAVAVARVADPYKVKTENLPVVVLTDEMTASSGEAVVIAFRGRSKTYFIGMPTRGLPTANQPFKLSDGAILNLTTAIEADRTGKTYDSKIPPDIEVKANWELYGTDRDPAIRAAAKWLRRQK